MIKQKSAIPLLFMSLMLLMSGCSTSSWMGGNRPMFANSAVMMVPLSDLEVSFEFDEGRLDEGLIDQLRTKTADSLGRDAFERMAESYQRAGLADVFVTNSTEDADYLLKVEEIFVSWVFTANMAHPGPNFRTRVTLSGWRGDELVFRASEIDHGNLASVAGGPDSRYYFPSDEELNDPEIQRDTVYPALRSAYGKALSKFFLDNR